MVVQGRGDVGVEVGVDTSGDPKWQGGHCHPFVGKRLGWHRTAGTTDRTATGLYGRLLVGHSVRPVGVGWVSEPGRRIVIKTAHMGRQPVESGQTWFGHHPAR